MYWFRNKARYIN